MAYTPMSPADQHADDAARFAALVTSADAEAWRAPAPVAGWTALDVVRHLIEWLPGFVAPTGVELSPVAADVDPGSAWVERSAEVQTVIEEQGDVIYSSPMLGEMPLARAIDQFYTNDVWMHSWDLARALGTEIDLGEERCEAALAALRPMDEVLRSSGQFGPAVEVSPAASAQDRLIAFIGRDPAWTP